MYRCTHSPASVSDLKKRFVYLAPLSLALFFSQNLQEMLKRPAVKVRWQRRRASIEKELRISLSKQCRDEPIAAIAAQ